MSEVNYPKQYKIYKTILKLLEARSYLIPEERSSMSLEQFKQIYQNNPQNVEIFGHLINQTSITVSLNLRRYKGEKIDKAFTQELLIKFRQFCNHIFIVARTEGKNGNLAIQKGALQQAQLASKLQQKQVHIEFFKQQNLLFNILEHQLVPQHILLNKAEKQALLDRYKIKESQLPKILLTDPVAQFLGLQRGEVVKIIRKSETAGTYITYRVAS